MHFHLRPLLVIRGHSWSFVVTRDHSWSLVCAFRHDQFPRRGMPPDTPTLEPSQPLSHLKLRSQHLCPVLLESHRMKLRYAAVQKRVSDLGKTIQEVEHINRRFCTKIFTQLNVINYGQTERIGYIFIRSLINLTSGFHQVCYRGVFLYYIRHWD